VKLGVLLKRAFPFIREAEVSGWVATLTRRYPSQMNVAMNEGNIDMVKEYFNAYSKRPRTNTIRSIREQGITIGNLLLDTTSALLFQAFKGSEPLVLYIKAGRR
jgi:hypothetical protein